MWDEESKNGKRRLIKLKIIKHEKIFAISLLIGISLSMLGGSGVQIPDLSDMSLELKVPKILKLEQTFAENEFIPISSYDRWLLNLGIRLSSEYNVSSLNYDSGNTYDLEYLSHLLKLQSQYERYIASVKNYDWERNDFVIAVDSFESELGEINHKIIFLKNSTSEIIYVEEHKKYEKFLPSMFPQ